MLVVFSALWLVMCTWNIPRLHILSTVLIAVYINGTTNGQSLETWAPRNTLMALMNYSHQYIAGASAHLQCNLMLWAPPMIPF